MFHENPFSGGSTAGHVTLKGALVFTLGDKRLQGLKVLIWDSDSPSPFPVRAETRLSRVLKRTSFCSFSLSDGGN